VAAVDLAGHNRELGRRERLALAEEKALDEFVALRTSWLGAAMLPRLGQPAPTR
jgi:hypothetical protein